MSRFVLSFVALLSTAGLAAVQDATFGTTSNLVSVYATVTQGDGQYVRDLTARDFRISDNGQPEPIVVFSNDVQPITLAMVVDESGSMLPRLPRVRAAAEAFAARLLPADRASFSTLTHVGVRLTADKRVLASAMRAAVEWPFWDIGSPIWGALDRAMTDLASQPGRRVLVIITDGLDTPVGYTNRPQISTGVRREVMKAATGAEIAARATREGFMLYAIGFAGSDFENDIKTIARQTGGGFDIIGADQNLTTAFTSIVDDLHRQYLLGFVPTSFDGMTHRIGVECLPSGTRVRARESYIADK
jgi:Ca-activated chloride channel family protein